MPGHSHIQRVKETVSHFPDNSCSAKEHGNRYCNQEELPGCQIALITSTSILNGTIDDLLCVTEGFREVVMLGPSTPLVPEVFQETPVSCLSGVIVVRPMEILQIVSEGGGTRYFHNAVDKVNIRT